MKSPEWLIRLEIDQPKNSWKEFDPLLMVSLLQKFGGAAAKVGFVRLQPILLYLIYGIG